MGRRAVAPTLGLTFVAMLASACGAPEERVAEASWWEETLTPADRVYSIEGLDGPESVRYDPDQDVWFIGNFAGDAGEADGNGFVTRVSAADGSIESLRFATGTDAAPFHSARGMFITGDTLWVNDQGGVHAFHRETGEQLDFIDFSSFEPGFLNDIVQGEDGLLYVTDTGRSRVYRIADRTVTVAVADTAIGGPNGITHVPEVGGFVLVPWFPGHAVQVWTPSDGARPLTGWGTEGSLDGVEWLGDRLLVAAQFDSTLYAITAESADPVIRVGAAPADIGLDRERRRVAVPFVSDNRVDVWQLGNEAGGQRTP